MSMLVRLLIVISATLLFVGSFGQPYVSLKKARKPRSASATATDGEVNQLLQRGHNYFNQNKPHDALNYFRQVIAKSPSNADAHLHVGLCHLRLGDGRQAIKAFEKAEKHDPNHRVAILKQGQLLDDMGRTRQAKQKFERLVEVDPDEPWSYYHLGNYAAESSSVAASQKAHQYYSKCADAFRKSLQEANLAPRQMGFHYEILGKCLMHIKQNEEVLKKLY